MGCWTEKAKHRKSASFYRIFALFLWLFSFLLPFSIISNSDCFKSKKWVFRWNLKGDLPTNGTKSLCTAASKFTTKLNTVPPKIEKSIIKYTIFGKNSALPKNERNPEKYLKYRKWVLDTSLYHFRLPLPYSLVPSLIYNPLQNASLFPRIFPLFHPGTVPYGHCLSLQISYYFSFFFSFLSLETHTISFFPISFRSCQLA